MPGDVQIKGNTILLASGEYFDYVQPNLSRFTIYDIAQGLSNTCRFSGQCPRFYSVAEHSVHVSHLVPDHLAFEALMHDAAEAFICDIPKPLKLLLPDYKIIEDRVEAAIAYQFGLILPLDPAIKAADRVMLATEQGQLMDNDHSWRDMCGARPSPAITIRALDPPAARELFLERFFDLQPLDRRRPRAAFP